jgi:cobalt-zinc-cadmium resistance protein CzcA
VEDNLWMRSTVRSTMVLASLRGINDPAGLTSLEWSPIHMDIDPLRMAGYGLSPGDIDATIKVAVAVTALAPLPTSP